MTRRAHLVAMLRQYKIDTDAVFATLLARIEEIDEPANDAAVEEVDPVWARTRAIGQLRKHGIRKGGSDVA